MNKMRIGDAQYVARVQQLLDEGRAVSKSEARRVVAQTECESGHTVTQLSVEGCAKEIADIQDGAVSSFADGRYIPPEPQPTQVTNIPKRRGRPPGSRNRPKEGK